MALITEELVEEWLNRKGYFTIRGVKVGTGEMDLLAVRQDDGRSDCWHYEVHGSLRPMAYVSDLPKDVQKKEGRGPRNAVHRSPELLNRAVEEWVRKKFLDVKKEKVRQALWPSKWNFGFVVAKTRHPEELPLIEEHGIRIVSLGTVLSETEDEDGQIDGATGSDLIDLVLVGNTMKPPKDRLR